MKNGKYVIGMCLTNIYLEHERNLLSSLYALSKDYPVKIIVFQCYYDRFGEGINTKTSTAVYDLINYDELDALVVNSYSIADPEIVKKLVARARQAGVPLISLDRKIKEQVDVVITNDRAQAFKNVIDHMIKQHHVQDVLYISGRKGDVTSDLREQIFRDVLEENDIEVDEDMIVYGDFWRVKTREVLRERYGHGEPLPEAIICGNDVSAQETCDFIFEIGKSVPEDVIVSGFDGFDTNQFYYPLLTTSGVDYNDYAKGVIESTIKLANKEECDKYYYTNSNLVKGESCGCCVVPRSQRVRTTSALFKHYTDRSHLDNIFFGMNTADIDQKGVLNLREQAKMTIFNESAIMINKDCYVEAGVPMGRHSLENPFTEKMVMVCGKDRHANVYDVREVDVKNLAPVDLTDVNSTGKITVVTPIVSPRNIYGYYVCEMNDFEDGSYSLQLLTRSLNNTLNLRDKTIFNNSLVHQVEDIEKRDHLTGLLNLYGLKSELDKLYKDDPDRLNYKLCISLYNMVSWQYIYQNYGIEDANSVSKQVADTLVMANPKDAFVGKISNDNFIVINYMEPDADLGEIINAATSSFYGTVEKLNSTSGKSYYIEVHAGCTTAMPGFKGTLNDLIKIANNEMLINRLRNNDNVERDKVIYSLEKKDKFFKLIDENLFTYNFQPIVDVKTGDIYAYEALMRTPPEIGLNPIEILDIASDVGRLYDIEKATVFNLLKIYYEKTEMFGGKKVFINTIPGHGLTERDFEKLFELYRSIGRNIVLEITEQTSSSDQEMKKFVEKLGSFDCQFAVDDYGSGNSNIVNLLKFSPNLIKIDRYLVENIHENVNKQMFVKNIIEFARKNNIKIIAEGVETKEELDTVIEYGVNFVQGYYTARPAASPIAAIDEKIINNIVEKNRREEF